ncbi:MAG: 3-hydroxyacyl-ACP dehydratase FabZ [Armatimonadetes bacterium]|nr:3-hydroxyacyl-ACP dehydratase FabZ [Armatimonadota bacterium]
MEEILKYLPHRYPILLVDRILEMEEGKRCVGIKNVTMNEPFFQGHYPGRPIMPGVLIVESMAQAGAVMILASPEFANYIPVIGSIEEAKFRRQVIPGDTLRHEIELVKLRGTVGKIKAVSTVDGEVAAEMTMTFVLVPKED